MNSRKATTKATGQLVTMKVVKVEKTSRMTPTRMMMVLMMMKMRKSELIYEDTAPDTLYHLSSNVIAINTNRKQITNMIFRSL